MTPILRVASVYLLAFQRLTDRLPQLAILSRAKTPSPAHFSVRPAGGPYPFDEMICRPVSARVGNVRNNDPSLIEPVALQ
jgi:hypothetical protein